MKGGEAPGVPWRGLMDPGRPGGQGASASACLGRPLRDMYWGGRDRGHSIRPNWQRAKERGPTHSPAPSPWALGSPDPSSPPFSPALNSQQAPNPKQTSLRTLWPPPPPIPPSPPLLSSKTLGARVCSSLDSPPTSVAYPASQVSFRLTPSGGGRALPVPPMHHLPH